LIQLRLVVYPLMYKVLYIPGGYPDFFHQQYDDSTSLSSFQCGRGEERISVDLHAMTLRANTIWNASHKNKTPSGTQSLMIHSKYTFRTPPKHLQASNHTSWDFKLHRICYHYQLDNLFPHTLQPSSCNLTPSRPHPSPQASQRVLPLYPQCCRHVSEEPGGPRMIMVGFLSFIYILYTLNIPVPITSRNMGDGTSQWPTAIWELQHFCDQSWVRHWGDVLAIWTWDNQPTGANLGDWLVCATRLLETLKFQCERLHCSWFISKSKLIWVFPKLGVGPQNAWFITENPIKMDDLGVALFLETPPYGNNEAIDTTCWSSF